jgi:SAM-dependent methyltransferase
MLVTRYALAAERAAGRDVLEVACGSGIGLGRLARDARRVVGGDVTAGLLRTARAHYGPRLPLARLDAQALPFRGGSFDVVVLYEAIYYLPDATRFVAEAHRVLRPGGELLVCTVNRAWSDFNPSPFSTRYHDAGELRALLAAAGFRVELLGGFPVGAARGTGGVVSLVKRSAVALGLMPRTMRGKQLLKRLFLGKLAPLPAEVRDDHAARAPLVPLPDDDAARFRVLYACGRRV